MNKLILLKTLVIVGFNLFGQDSVKLVNKWKLIKYEAFEKVKNSPAYFLADDENVKKYHETVKLLLDSVWYDFKSDNTLVYVDLENGKAVRRPAKWSLDDDVLSIVELNRPYSRKAKVLKLTAHELVLSPIIDGIAGDAPMTFAPMPVNKTEERK